MGQISSLPAGSATPTIKVMSGVETLLVRVVAASSVFTSVAARVIAGVELETSDSSNVAIRDVRAPATVSPSAAGIVDVRLTTDAFRQSSHVSD